MKKDLFRAMYHNSYHRNDGMPWNLMRPLETSQPSLCINRYEKWVVPSERLEG